MKIIENYKLQKHYYEMWEQPGETYNVLKYIKEQVETYFNYLKCKHLGEHKWEYDCNIGPDSGSESIECTSCGESYSNTYY
jgi:hypothetical protein